MSAALHARGPATTAANPPKNGEQSPQISHVIPPKTGVHPDAGPLRTTAKGVHACTAAQMAAEAGVSRRMIFLGLKVQRAGCAELHRMIRDGSVTMSLAAVLVDLFPNHDDQRTVLAEFATLPARQWLGFARRVAALMKGQPSPEVATVATSKAHPKPSANPAKNPGVSHPTRTKAKSK
jgi:hypothetical protein